MKTFEVKIKYSDGRAAGYARDERFFVRAADVGSAFDKVKLELKTLHIGEDRIDDRKLGVVISLSISRIEGKILE